MSRVRAVPRRRRRVVSAGWVAAAIGLLCLLGVASARERPAARERVLELLGKIHLSMVDGRYHPVTRVDETEGRYQFDCSGMATWILRRVAPLALRDVLSQAWTSRPVARDFVRQLWHMRPGKTTRGWKRIARVEDLRGGDLVAWLKPDGQQDRVTGHVGFAVARPRRSTLVEGGYLVRFADSSKYRHQDDTRDRTDRDGFGVGTLLLVADPEKGMPVAYGWRGEEAERLERTRIVMGRPRR